MKRGVYDYWVLLKYHLRLPLPISNHFHKGKRIKTFEYWYCTVCHNVFKSDLWTKKENKSKLLSDLTIVCPQCGSTKCNADTDLVKAVYEKQSKSSIIKLMAQKQDEIRRFEERIKQQKKN